MVANTMNERLKEIKSGTAANGVSYPRLNDKLFTNNPNNIRNEMLSPTDSTNFSVDPILSNFRTRRINNPGKMVRKRNPMICLTNGMSKRMATSVIKIKPIKMHFLIPRSFINFILSWLKCFTYNLLPILVTKVFGNLFFIFLPTLIAVSLKKNKFLLNGKYKEYS